ncbi:TetR/AcrR family transcriptional regulator [Lentilactobacillus sp. SPB1-3]|uniref:TetR/AcrR family transcriptional regulator n=1 Tax=Lentilactobacillus terminaliae TaxID=3003483 RepID=A0ACD5DEC2_9LACO|nr:TetR/AcrR family transcriptional regulator [Lentilactobacillus sp. SPB1-3]MCZ0977678.1 TetR/AcrR family transcriptional regulator [Lentilactobacillus sp. SPB1-3]
MRIKEFNPEEVLEKAELLFWQQGYEKTSIQNLVDTMGISRRSMYDTFGDKHKLFLLSLNMYYEQTSQEIANKLDESSNLGSNIKLIFDTYIHHSSKKPVGCLLVNSATELSIVDPEAYQKIKFYFRLENDALLALLERFSDDLLPNTNLVDVAKTLQNSLIGIRVLAKVNPQVEQLDSIVDHTIKALPWKDNEL